MPDGSYSISDIQDYFEYIIKKHWTITNNSLVQIYVNKIKNRIVFKIKIDYKLELLSLENLKLSGSTYLLKLEFAEAVLVHGNLVKNNNQQAAKYYSLLYQTNNLDS